MFLLSSFVFRILCVVCLVTCVLCRVQGVYQHGPTSGREGADQAGLKSRNGSRNGYTLLDVSVLTLDVMV